MGARIRAKLLKAYAKVESMFPVFNTDVMKTIAGEDGFPLKVEPLEWTTKFEIYRSPARGYLAPRRGGRGRVRRYVRGWGVFEGEFSVRARYGQRRRKGK